MLGKISIKLLESFENCVEYSLINAIYCCKLYLSQSFKAPSHRCLQLIPYELVSHIHQQINESEHKQLPKVSKMFSMSLYWRKVFVKRTSRRVCGHVCCLVYHKYFRVATAIYVCRLAQNLIFSSPENRYLSNIENSLPLYNEPFREFCRILMVIAMCISNVS